MMTCKNVTWNKVAMQKRFELIDIPKNNMAYHVYRLLEEYYVEVRQMMYCAQASCASFGCFGYQHYQQTSQRTEHYV
jgi:hypothetical protein